MARQTIQGIYDTAFRLLRHHATDNLKKLLFRLHPADLADVIQKFTVHDQDVIIGLIHDYSKLPEMFSELEGDFLKEYLERNNNFAWLSEILQKLPSDDLTDLVGKLPQEMADELLSHFQTEQSQDVTGLLQYQESTAGGLMSTEVFKLAETISVKEAILSLQNISQVATFFYIYVVNSVDQLTGVISIRQLFQNSPDKQLKDIMIRDVIRVGTQESQDVVARIVAQYNLVAIPVVEENNTLVGVITVDDVIDVIHEEAKETALKMGIVESEDLNEQGLIKSLTHKIPWFVIFLLGAIVNSEIINHYYSFLPAMGIFAGFIPLMLRMGGIISRQSATIMIQSIYSNQFNLRSILKTFLRQAIINSVIALVAIGIMAFYSYFRFHQVGLLPLAIGICLFAAMLVSHVLGNTLPYLFSKIKLDPGLASHSLINFVLDVLVLFIYFKVLIVFFQKS
ncbi:magnesium transporter [bacterium]|nr:magnesium transporter [bacterium]